MVSLVKSDNFPVLSPREIQQYLESGLFHGIGRKTAQTLVEHFGEQTLYILDAHPQMLKSIPDLGDSRITKIKEAWEDNKKNPHRLIIAELLGVGASLNLALKICECYGRDTSTIIKGNPYRLIDDIDGIGFKTADQLALRLGLPPSSPIRYKKGILHILKESMSEGHCYLPEWQLLERAAVLLERPDYTVNPKNLEICFAELLQDKILLRSQNATGIYQKPVYRAEVSIALKIHAHLEQGTNSTDLLEKWLGELQEKYKEVSPLSEEQINALVMAVENPISIITGGPGRGKTYVLKTLVDWLSKGLEDIALVAPTGKAANRMKDATGMEATTIHRLLQWRGKEQVFTFNEKNPLDIDFLIVDEFSMVDTFLFNSLLKALPLKTQIVLVGDFDQLPSVGPGMVLRDLIISGCVPITRLTKIFRQKDQSPIVYAASDVNDGKIPALERFEKPTNWMSVSDCAMLITKDAQSTAEAIVELVKSMQAEGVDLKNQLMVLAPQKDGAAGVHNLNKLLAPIFNPQQENQAEVVVGSVSYRVGDRVIQLKNRYKTTPPVMNGEMGFVVDVLPKEKLVRIVFEGGATVVYSQEYFEQIMHSFCITCHKSQGSEFPYVIFPLLTANYRMLIRQLLYTTMTRAMGTFIAVGQEKALSIAVSTDRPAKRFTGLANLLISTTKELIQLFSTTKSADTYTSSSRSIFSTPIKVSVGSRLRDRSIVANPGVLVKIGRIALLAYQEKYGYKPCRQPEQIGDYRFDTYHYEPEAVDLVDGAINSVLGL